MWALNARLVSVCAPIVNYSTNFGPYLLCKALQIEKPCRYWAGFHSYGLVTRLLPIAAAYTSVRLHGAISRQVSVAIFFANCRFPSTGYAPAAGNLELAATLKEPQLCREVFKTLFLFLIIFLVYFKSYKVEPAFIRCNPTASTS